MSANSRIWEEAWSPGVSKDIHVEKSIPEYFRDAAEAYPDHIAVHFYGKEITYKALSREINQFTCALIDSGFKKGDRIGLFLPNCPQYIISYFGILQAGGVVVALNPMFKAPELEHEINDAGIEVLVCSDSLYPEVEKVRRTCSLRLVLLTSLRDYLPTAPILPFPKEAMVEKSAIAETTDFLDFLANAADDFVCPVEDLRSELALLQYTSGTSGMPKGAMITHYGLSLACLGANTWFSNHHKDIFLSATPFFHIMGMIQSMCCPLISGGTMVILSRFVPLIVAQTIEHYKCTAWVGTTTMLIALMQVQDIEKYNMSGFRYVVSGGAPIGVELQKRFGELVPGAMMIEGYGLTECISQGGAVTPLGGYRPGFVGVPYLNDLKIVDTDNGFEEVDFGIEGEIIIKGDCLMTGYWHNPEATAKVFRDGWLYTGDIGAMDEKGYVKISGRSKELIKCSGFSVFPAEVENLMYRHPAVKEVAVVGIEDPYRGESPKAFVVLQPDYQGKITEEEVINWCKENMATYKRPRDVAFLDDLPKNAAGKVLRRKLTSSK